MTAIAVIDHGAGNLVSMEQALARVGATPTRVSTGHPLDAFDGVVLPGVGATAPAIRNLTRAGLVEPLMTYPGPLLGVCVGMQLLFETSDEDAARCLGRFGGRVRRIDASPLPHMGWNDVTHDGRGILSGIAPGEPFYFVHSYVPEPTDTSIVIGTCAYGDDTLVVAVQDGNTTALQFHPERSGDAGLAVLANFVARCAEGRRAA